MGLAGLWELVKNSNGVHIVADSASRFLSFGRSTIQVGAEPVSYAGGMHVAAPAVSPALMGVGFIVGFRVSAVLFAGALMGWLVLVPLALFLNPAWANEISSDLAINIWLRQIRPLAVGTMIVAAFYTLYNLRTSLIEGIRKAVKNVGAGSGGSSDRTEIDIDFKKTAVGVGVASIATFFLYNYFAGLRGRRSAAHDRDGRARVPVRRGGGIPRRPHRQLQQPDLRAHVERAPDLGRPDGPHRTHGREGGRRRARRGRASCAAPPGSPAT